MTKIYLYKFLPGVPYLPVLYPEFGVGPWFEKHLFNELVFKYYKETFFTLVKNVSKADFILIPHIYKFISDHSYLREAENFAKQAGKPLILSAFGDNDNVVVDDSTIVFRYTQYRHRKRDNDIMTPTHSPGASLETLIYPQKKINEIPVLGFCGWADYANIVDKLKASTKNLFWGIMAILVNTPAMRARKKGIYFRKKALAELSKSKIIKTSFIVRKSFSSHKETISLDSGRARKEFVVNILESDLSLAIKGDGNTSVRFYEILSLGRIPIIIDTDCILPLEDIIDYRDFCLIIPYEKIYKADVLIRKFYDEMSEQDFLNKQRIAYTAFNNYLRADKFYRFIFSNPKEILKRVKINN